MFDPLALNDVYHHNTDAFLDILQMIDPALLSVKPSEREWSVLEVCEHIMTLEQTLQFVLNGPTTPLNRQAIRQVAFIKDTFSDFNQRLKAPPRVRPIGRISNLNQVLIGFPKNREMLWEQGDWESIYTGFAHPLFGQLTKAEWLYFCVFHTQRHLYQIERIMQRIS